MMRAVAASGARAMAGGKRAGLPGIGVRVTVMGIDKMDKLLATRPARARYAVRQAIRKGLRPIVRYTKANTLKRSGRLRKAIVGVIKQPKRARKYTGIGKPVPGKGMVGVVGVGLPFGIIGAKRRDFGTVPYRPNQVGQDLPSRRFHLINQGADGRPGTRALQRGVATHHGYFSMMMASELRKELVKQGMVVDTGREEMVQ